MPPRRRAVAAWTAVGLAVFVTTYLLYLGRPVNRTDETWMLWLTQRVARGDVLYRDVYDVTTPLAAWAGAVVTLAAGAQIAALRGLVAASFALQVAIAGSIARRCGVRPPGVAVLVVALVAFGSPLAAFTSLYSSMAVLGALASLRAVLWWYDCRASGSPADRALVTIGVATAFSFWCKPNIGGLVLLAVVASIALGSIDRRHLVAQLLVFGSALAAFSAVVLGVIVATGAWPAFVDQVFLSKRQYVDVGFSYFTALRRRWEVVTAAGGTDLRSFLQLSVLAAPCLVLAAVIRGCWSHRRVADPRSLALMGFAAAGLLAVYPRPGVNHFVGTMPLTSAAAVGIWALAPRRYLVRAHARRLALAVAATVAVVGVAVAVGDSMRSYSDERVVRELPHFEAVPVRRGAVTQARALRRDLRAHTDGEVFIAREDAGFLYFQTGTRDPLPYDMAERSDFGAGGERGVIRRLEHGDVRWVCLHPPRPGTHATASLVPRVLERWVRAHFALVGRYRACDLYRDRAGRATGPRA